MGEDLRHRYPELAELADGPEVYAITREIESRDLAIDRWRERAETAEAKLNHARTWAEYHATRCEDYCCDHAPGLLAALDDSQEVDLG